VLLGPARVHAEQHLGPVLRLGAALARLDLDVGVVGVGLAREEALELALRRLVAQRLERFLGLGDDALVALGLPQLDQPERVVDLALDPAVSLDRPLEFIALAQRLLRGVRVIPQVGILGGRVQLGETPVCVIPVKDASSAGRATSGSRRPLLALQRASRSSGSENMSGLI
jgi:hypothetical protein